MLEQKFFMPILFSFKALLQKCNLYWLFTKWKTCCCSGRIMRVVQFMHGKKKHCFPKAANGSHETKGSVKISISSPRLGIKRKKKSVRRWTALLFFSLPLQGDCKPMLTHIMSAKLASSFSLSLSLNMLCGTLQVSVFTTTGRWVSHVLCESAEISGLEPECVSIFHWAAAPVSWSALLYWEGTLGLIEFSWLGLNQNKYPWVQVSNKAGITFVNV